jgi:hypothetical protein
MRCTICSKPFRKGYEHFANHNGQLIAAHPGCLSRHEEKQALSSEAIFVVQRICSNARHYAENYEKTGDRYCAKEAEIILKDAANALERAQLSIRRNLRRRK